MFRALDDHVAYSSLPLKFPKGDINARQQALNVLPTILIGASNAWKKKDGPILYLHHHCKHRAGAGHGLPCHSLLKRADPAPMRRSHDGRRKDYIPTAFRTRRTSARAFIHGGLAALRSRHLSS